MRVAVVSDIHGNYLALQAVLEHLKTQKVDELVIAGDTVNALPDSKACWDRVLSLGCVVLRGNHERYLYDYGTPQADPSWATERFRGLLWTLKQFGQADLDKMRSLPMTYPLPGLLICHASPHNDQENVSAQTPRASLERMLRGTDEPLLVRGHNHVWLEHRFSGRVLLSIGSAGLPLNGNRAAQYLILDQAVNGWRWEKQFVPYDTAAALARFKHTGYSEKGGALVPLFYQELATAELHLLPFLKRYLAAVERGDISLTVAVQRFLAEG